MCSNWALSDSQDLELQNYLNIIKESANFGVEHINTAGGDPLLYPEIYTLCGEIKKVGLEAAMVTMGCNITMTNAETLVRTGIDIVRFSLDAPDPDVHNFIRGVPFAFQRTVRGIKQLTEIKNQLGLNKPRIEINMTIMQKNAGFAEDMLDFSTQLNVDRLNYSLVTVISPEVIQKTNKHFNMNVCSKQFTGNENRQLLLTENEAVQSREIFKRIFDRDVESKTNVGIILKMLLRVEDVIEGDYLRNELDSKMLICPSPSSRLVINSQGEIFPCSSIRYSFGNIQKESLISIWKNQKRQAFIDILNSDGWAAICYKCCSLKPI